MPERGEPMTKMGGPSSPCRRDRRRHATRRHPEAWAGPLATRPPAPSVSALRRRVYRWGAVPSSTSGPAPRGRRARRQPERDRTRVGRPDHRLRHGRLARPDRRGVHLRQRASLRAGCRRMGPRSRASGARASSSATTGASRASTSRAAAAEVLLAHDIPVLFAATAIPTQMTSYEVVERDAAGAVVITASHNPWTDNGFKIKSPTGAAADPAILAGRGGHRGPSAGETPPRRPFAEAEAAGTRRALRPVPGLRGLRAAHPRPRPPARRRHARPRRPALRLGRRLDRPAAGGRSHRRRRDPQRAQPVVRWPQPGAHPTPRRRGPGARPRRAATTSASCSTVTPTGPARSTSRAPSSTSSSAWGCSCTTCSSIAASAPRSSRRSTRRPWPSASASATACPSTRRRWASSTWVRKMIETGAMMGGEESGGYGFGMHLPERDGIYADLLLLDLFIREREAGRDDRSRRRCQHLHEIAGPSFYLRDDVHADRASYPALKARLLVELGEHCPGQRWPDAVSRARRRSTRATASSSGWTTGPGCSSASAVPSRWCGSTPRPAARSCVMPCGRHGRPDSRRGRRQRCAAGLGGMDDGWSSSRRRDGGILDDLAAMERADPGGMLGLVAGFPDQVEEAWRLSRGLELPVEPRRGRSPSWAWAARPSAATS